MTTDLEQLLRDHLADAPGPGEPSPGQVAAVLRRGRRRRRVQTGLTGAAAVAAIAVLAIPLALVGDEPDVILAPGPAPVPVPVPEPLEAIPPDGLPGGGGPLPAPSDDPDPLADEAPDGATVEAGAPRAVAALGGAVLQLRPDGVLLLRDGEEARPVAEDVTAVLPDGVGGAVVELAHPDGEALHHLPAPIGKAPPTPLRSAPELTLRAVTPDGMVLHSLPPERVSDEDVETRWFAVPVDGTGGTEPIGSHVAYDGYTVGPVAVAGGAELVHASCHIHCALWPGAFSSPVEEPLYMGRAIDGLSAARDGSRIAFVDHDPTYEGGPVELVVLESGTFEEVGRVPLPLEHGVAGERTVASIHPDGRRVLVSPAGRDSPAPLVIELGASGEATVQRVAEEGMLIWLEELRS